MTNTQPIDPPSGSLPPSTSSSTAEVAADSLFPVASQQLAIMSDKPPNYANSPPNAISDVPPVFPPSTTSSPPTLAAPAASSPPSATSPPTPLIPSIAAPSTEANNMAPITSNTPISTPSIEYLFDADQTKSLNGLKEEVGHFALETDAFSIIVKDFLDLHFENLPMTDIPCVTALRKFLNAWKLQADDKDAPFNDECSSLNALAGSVASFLQLVESRCSLQIQRFLDDSSRSQDIWTMFCTRFPAIGKEILEKLGALKVIDATVGMQSSKFTYLFIYSFIRHFF